MDTERIFPADLTQLHSVMQWIRAHLLAARCDEINVRKIELALEEAIVNIVEHAYQRKGGQILIRFSQPKISIAEITLKDQGPPFNPLEHQDRFDPLASLEERNIGGLGIFLLTQYMDEVRYSREGNHNVLTLSKDITHSSQTK